MPTKVLISWPVPIDYTALENALPNAEFSYCALEDPAIFKAVSDAAIWVAGGPPVTNKMLDCAKKLRWLQMFGAGLPPGIFEKNYEKNGFILTNAKGVNVINMAEHAIMFILAFSRGLPTLMQRQEKEQWITQVNAPTLFEVQGKTVGILGYGAIGSAVAVRARALGMKVWAMRRNPTAMDISEVDQMFPPDELHKLIAGADHVILTLPLTEATTGLIGADELAAMKPTAYLHNIGRGKLVDQDALIEALKSKQIAGAGLDTVTPEPLPPGHPLWKTPNVLITGHLAGNTPEFFPRVMAYIAENMRLYDRGEPLQNQIDLEQGL